MALSKSRSQRNSVVHLATTGTVAGTTVRPHPGEETGDPSTPAWDPAGITRMILGTPWDAGLHPATITGADEEGTTPTPPPGGDLPLHLQEGTLTLVEVADTQTLDHNTPARSRDRTVT